MAFDEATAARVRALLSRRPRVAERRMMGALAILVDGAICCSVGAEGLLVRVAREERESLLALRHVTPMQLGGRTMRGFVRVSPAGFRTQPALSRWIERGIAAAAGRAGRAERPASSKRGRGRARGPGA